MKKLVIAMLACALFAAPAEAVKEKANKTKCSTRISNIGSSGQDGIKQVAALLLPAIQKLRGNTNQMGARRLAETGMRLVRHRGHVTVLKINQTADHCLAKLKRRGADRKEIEEVQAARAAAIRDLRAVEQANFDSFFDIWTEIS